MKKDVKGHILFVDDDEHVCRAVEQTLKLSGYEITTFRNPRQAMKFISRNWPGILLTDVKMPEMDGFSLLEWTIRQDPDLPVLLVTGHGDISMAVEAMRKGAYDFIEKPLSSERLLEAVARAVEKRRLIMYNRELRAEVALQSGLESIIIGRSEAITRLRERIRAIVDARVDVLIIGETGTGKELVARCLHRYSSRGERPFIAINCGAIPESIIENELFGHEPGAFTGANRLYTGKFEQANGGTLFLDEIESMPLGLQVRLLRVLQERSIERLGGTKTIELDLRIIAATKRDLREASERGEFRSDLYYRLNVANLVVPPLRKRVEDIPTLFIHFLHKAAERLGRPVPSIDGVRFQQFMEYSWPGNVRELQNVAERMVLGMEDFTRDMNANLNDEKSGRFLRDRLESFEKYIIEEELKRHKGNITTTYKVLGLPRKTLYNKMRKYGLIKKNYT